MAASAASGLRLWRRALRNYRRKRAVLQSAVPAPLARFGAAALSNPSLERDLHRHGTRPASPWFLSSASRAKRHSGSGPSAQTLGVAQARSSMRNHGLCQFDHVDSQLSCSSSS
jgi:hypothetical protein